MDNQFDFNNAKPQLRLVQSDGREDRVRALRRTLLSRVPEFIRYLFPEGVASGSEMRVGSVAGERGESLAIGLKGDNAGLWKDHATGEGGDIIDLWMAVQGYGKGDFGKALDDLESYCGISSKPISDRVQRVATERKAKAPADAGRPFNRRTPTQTYVYSAIDGTEICRVYRYDTLGEKKSFLPFVDGQPGAPAIRPIYRLPHIHDQPTVVVVEGEKCADALAALGIPATSLMSGAKAPIEKSDLTPLAGKNAILWPDNDEVGIDLMNRLRPHLEALGCTVTLVEIPADAPAKWDAADAVEAGLDVAAMIAAAHKPKRTPWFPLTEWDDCSDVRRPDYLVDGLITTHGISVLYGAPGSMKTFVAIDMALCIATGRPWQGKAIKPGRVIYIAGEGQYGVAMRATGWGDYYDVATTGKPRFAILPGAVPMDGGEYVDRLIDDINHAPEKPVLIILDTITRMFASGSQLNDEDMTSYVRSVDRLHQATGAHIMSIGHSGKDKAKGLFGSIILTGAADTIIYCERERDTITLQNSAPMGKQKDGEECPNIVLVANNHEFATRDGEVVKTAILSLEIPPEASPAQLAAIRDRQQEEYRLFMSEVVRTMLAHGHVSPDTAIFHRKLCDILPGARQKIADLLHRNIADGMEIDGHIVRRIDTEHNGRPSKKYYVYR